MKTLFTFCFCVLAWVACSPPVDPETLEKTWVLKRPATLYKEPSKESAVLKNLAKDIQVIETEKVSPHIEKFNRQDEIALPWVYVMVLKDSTFGWMHSSLLVDTRGKYFNSQRRAVLLASAHFGNETSKQLVRYRKNYLTANTDSAFVLSILHGDSMAALIETQLARQQKLKTQQQPEDLRWMPLLLKGFDRPMRNEKGQWGIFRSFQDLRTRATEKQCPATIAFADLAIQIYNDNQGWFHTSYHMDVDERFYNTLGDSLQYKMLQNLSALQHSYPQMKPCVQALQSKLINSLTADKIDFWLSAEKVIIELNMILKDSKIDLLRSDRVALEVLREHLLHPTENHIVTNKRAG